MKPIQPAILLARSAFLVSAALAAQTNESHWFHFDRADEIVLVVNFLPACSTKET